MIKTGRLIKENNTPVNIADLLEQLVQGTTTTLKIGAFNVDLNHPLPTNDNDTNTALQDVLLKITELTPHSAVLSTNTATFANNAPIDTMVTIELVPPAANKEGPYLVELSNPSLETDLNVRIYLKDTFGASTVWHFYSAFTVPKSPDNFCPDQVGKVAGKAVIIESAMACTGMALVISNSALVGAAGTFEAKVITRKV